MTNENGYIMMQSIINFHTQLNAYVYNHLFYHNVLVIEIFPRRPRPPENPQQITTMFCNDSTTNHHIPS